MDIIFIVVVTIADCDDWEETEWFAREKEPWFRKYLELPAGIPSHDTMQRVFSRLDPELFRQRFREWTALACGREADARILYTAKKEKGHGRIERRDYYVCGDIAWLDPEGRWKDLKSIGMARNRV